LANIWDAKKGLDQSIKDIGYTVSEYSRVSTGDISNTAVVYSHVRVAGLSNSESTNRVIFNLKYSVKIVRDVSLANDLAGSKEQCRNMIADDFELITNAIEIANVSNVMKSEFSGTGEIYFTTEKETQCEAVLEFDITYRGRAF